VVACNAAAVECGVRLRMPLAEAAALAERGDSNARGGHSPPYKDAHPAIVPHDPAGDLAELARLAERCERFSPIVGWETAEGRNAERGVWKAEGGRRSWGPDCLFLDVTGIGVLFGGEEQLAGAVVADCAELGYEARVAVADTIGAAWAVATQGGSKFKVQSSKIELTWNLNCLRVEPETLDLLAQLGITTLDQLLALPRETLRARFGERLLLRVDQLLGTAQEIIVPHRPPPQFIEEWLLEYPAERREVIEQIVRELVRRVATELANRREGILKLNCRLDCAPGRPVMFGIGLFRPSADERHLWDLVAMQLEQAKLPGPVGRVRIEAGLTGRLENRQGELFAGNQHEAERQLALLIDRCSSRLGPTAVLRPQLTVDPLPERAARYVKGVRGQGTGVRKFKIQDSKFKVRDQATLNSEWTRCAGAPTWNSLLRPLFLHSPPQVLEVMSIAPDGPPVLVGFQGQKHEVVAWSGPERIEAGWWRGKTMRRDYWRVVTATGQRFWLFRQLDGGQWFLHGEFA
jgi:protein ImuB